MAVAVIAGTDETETLYVVDDRNPTGWPQVLEEHLITDNKESIANVVYTYGNDLISQTRPDDLGWRTHFYGYACPVLAGNGHGNVRYLTDGTGEITDTYDGACPVLAGDAFGNLIRQAVFDPLVGMIVEVDPTNIHRVTENAYLYTGEQFDADLGMYFLRARYMDPNLGRFHFKIIKSS